MNAASPTIKNFRIMAILELLFTATSIPQTPSLLGLESGPATAMLIVLSLARIGVYWLVLSWHLRPTEATMGLAAEGEAFEAAQLREADARLQSLPLRMGFLTAAAYGVSNPLLLMAYRAFVGQPNLPGSEWELVVTMTLTALFGAVGVVVPLLSWTLSGVMGETHVLAVERGVKLKRPSRSIAGRLILISVCMSGAPIAQSVGNAIAAEARSSLSLSAVEATAAAAELRHVAGSGGLDGALAALGPHVDRHRTSVFVLDGADLVVRGAHPPDWATPAALTAAVDHAVSRRGGSAHATRLPDGRIVGAMVTPRPRGAGFVASMAADLGSLILLAIVCSWVLSRSVTVPLARTAELARRAARDGDLSKMGTLPISERDEVGTVMHNLNELIGNMRSIADAASAVGAGTLTVHLSGSGELPEAFRRMLAQLQGVVQEMHGTSTELAAAATEILAASQEQEAASTSHSTGMREISQTMESLSDSAAHVATAVQGVLANAERTLQTTDRMDQRIEELTGHASRIGDILEVIRDIADRTDLLALNGSLEASRAGEAGVGFSLVASEMRRLAERVTASVGDIKSLVSDIRESGASTVVATEESKKLADATTQAARSIAMVTMQQQSSTEQVTQHVRSVAEVVQQAAAATTQTRASADGLKRHAERLTTVVGRFQLEH